MINGKERKALSRGLMRVCAGMSPPQRRMHSAKIRNAVQSLFNGDVSRARGLLNQLRDSSSLGPIATHFLNGTKGVSRARVPSAGLPHRVMAALSAKGVRGAMAESMMAGALAGSPRIMM